jgi:nitric oxide dioxygenase
MPAEASQPAPPTPQEMPMSPVQIAFVKASFATLAHQPDTFPSSFYGRLFEIDPGLRHLFPSNLTAQRAKLMQMLGLAVHGLDDLRALLPAVQSLGARHAAYGVVEAHYATVGQALLDALRASLRGGCTPELEAAWAAVYTVLAGAMQAGAGQPAVADA